MIVKEFIVWPVNTFPRERVYQYDEVNDDMMIESQYAFPNRSVKDNCTFDTNYNNTD